MKYFVSLMKGVRLSDLISLVNVRTGIAESLLNKTSYDSYNEQIFGEVLF